MGFDVVSAVVSRPFSTGPGRSAEVARAWVRVASIHEGEIAARMVSAAVADGHRGRVPPSNGGSRVGVRHSSIAARVLALLGGCVGGLTVGEIAKALGDVSVRSVMWCTTDMQSRGLVTRSHGSGAGVFVAMTERGREVLSACERVEVGQ
ncbi:MarR family transcriptional regulator [Celeribacter ethanolicus]|uniref:MarR family transcriptional regulator n=1 Tax=Celeribacter ethanolicus TaxID=1758178 RepID=UPI0008364904|nr:MarR family transcriptional regulator [Celeribacter ethanolicus]